MKIDYMVRVFLSIILVDKFGTMHSLKSILFIKLRVKGYHREIPLSQRIALRLITVEVG